MAPTTAGTNVITQNEDLIVDTLANLAEFQAWTGTTGDLNAAKKRCIVELDDSFDSNDELFAETPYCIISPAGDTPQANWTAYSKDIPYAFQCDTTVIVTFFAAVPATWEDNKQDEMRKFKNVVGDIMVAFINQAGLDNKFGSTNVFDEPVMWPREDNTQTDRLAWTFNVQRTQEAGGAQ